MVCVRVKIDVEGGIMVVQRVSLWLGGVALTLIVVVSVSSLSLLMTIKVWWESVVLQMSLIVLWRISQGEDGGEWLMIMELRKGGTMIALQMVFVLVSRAMCTLWLKICLLCMVSNFCKEGEGMKSQCM
jgi:hypothetical protein